MDGKFLATSSSNGSLIRLFNTSDGSLLQELRRGTHGDEIHSLAFSSTAQWLAVSSDRRTVHVFRLSLDSGNERPESPETKPFFFISSVAIFIHQRSYITYLILLD